MCHMETVFRWVSGGKQLSHIILLFKTTSQISNYTWGLLTRDDAVLKVKINNLNNNFLKIALVHFNIMLKYI